MIGKLNLPANITFLKDMGGGGGGVIWSVLHHSRQFRNSPF